MRLGRLKQKLGRLQMPKAKTAVKNPFSIGAVSATALLLP